MNGVPTEKVAGPYPRGQTVPKERVLWGGGGGGVNMGLMTDGSTSQYDLKVRLVVGGVMTVVTDDDDKKYDDDREKLK